MIIYIVVVDLVYGGAQAEPLGFEGDVTWGLECRSLDRASADGPSVFLTL